jgi:hypothetical protein
MEPVWVLASVLAREPVWVLASVRALAAEVPESGLHHAG